MSGRSARILLASSMFIMGACGIVYEYVLSVLGNYLIGSSHEEIFIIIGIMMFAMGTGTIFQQHIRENLVDAFLTIEIILGLIGGFAAAVVYSVFAVSESYRVVLYGFAYITGMLIGMEIPILVRINREYASSLRANLSEILSMDYLGSLGGAVLFTYVLLSQVSLARIGFILGGTNALVALVGLVAFRQLVRRKRLITMLVVITTGALVVGCATAGGWMRWAEQRYFADPMIYSETSHYQHLVLTRRGDRVRLYINGHLQFSSTDEAIYHELLVHPAMQLAASRRNVLVLGGGDGLAVREILKYRDVESVTLVDIDPAVVRLATTDPEVLRLNQGSLADARVKTQTGAGTSDGPRIDVRVRSGRRAALFDETTHPVARVRVALIDADLFLRRTGETYDVAFLDFPDPGQLEIAKLYSREFYRSLHRKLGPEALVAVQSTSPFHARRVFLCIGKTLREAGFSAIPYHQNVPSFGEWGFWIARPGLGQQAKLRTRLCQIVSLEVPTRFATPEVIAASTVFGKGWLDETASIAANTKMNPVLTRYYRESWKGY